MTKVNLNYKNLKESYLFSDIANKINAYQAEHPDAKIIRMGIGDVTKPLVPQVIKGLVRASEEMGKAETFRGYGPEQGYGFLREKIKDYYMSEMKVDLEADEIFVSDGAKSDIANITDLFSNDNVIAVQDPVYPVYIDTNVMLGRKVVFLEGNEANGFLPMPAKDLKADIVYLCSPNNPTGSAYSREQLKIWVEYALKNDAVIIYDAAYESFITEDLPRSIYEIEGAKECAIEFCSFSKTAGFTGTRCGYTVVPKKLIKEGMCLNKMWLRRQTTKFNGVSYITQVGASEVFTKDGLKQVREVIASYMENAKIMADTLGRLGIQFTGGINSPYIWLKCPDNMDSWKFFDALLDNARVVGTPGVGFGKCGEGYFRLTAFNTKENTIEAMRRFSEMITKK